MVKRHIWRHLSLALFSAALLLAGCGSDTQAPLAIKSNKNVIYKHGDMMKYTASGGYTRADGSRTLLTGGWLRLEILDEGLKNPLNNNIPVLSLIEAQLYEGKNVDKNGNESPLRVINYLYRHFVQDPANGTIKYQGEKLIEGYDGAGKPIWRTFWFETPKDYVQYQFPLNLGDSKTLQYLKRTGDGSNLHSGNVSATVDALESVSLPIGSFQTYRMSYLETSADAANAGALISDRVQYIYPEIGFVRFDFKPSKPGDTGVVTMALAETNIPYRGGNSYKLANNEVAVRNAPGYLVKFDRSGFYLSDDGTLDEISGWFTMDFTSETVFSPLLNKTLNTLLETHVTETKTTDIIGNVTTTAKREAFKRYCYPDSSGNIYFAGDTGQAGTPAAGQPIWFDAGFIPMEYPYFVGETKSQTINVFTWMNNQGLPLYSFTPSMKVVSTLDVNTTLGSFECYMMTYADTNGKTVEQYSYPKLGVAKFRYPAPGNRVGYMGLTVSSTNVPYQ